MAGPREPRHPTSPAPTTCLPSAALIWGTPSPPHLELCFLALFQHLRPLGNGVHRRSELRRGAHPGGDGVGKIVGGRQV